MTVNVGVIGVGMIGQDHIRRLTHVLSGPRVAAVTDVDLDRAKSVADGLPERARCCETGQDLIADDGSTPSSSPPGAAPTRSTCWPASPRASRSSARSRWPPPGRPARRILDAEAAGRQRLVMVGFMRRYDDAYRAMKAALDARSRSAPRWCTTPGTATRRCRPASPPTACSSTPACTTSTSPGACSTPRSSRLQVFSPRRSSLRRRAPAGPGAAACSRWPTACWSTSRPR